MAQPAGNGFPRPHVHMVTITTDRGRPSAPFSRRDLLRLAPARPASRSAHWIRVHRRAMACRFEVTLSGERARDVPHAVEALSEADSKKPSTPGQVTINIDNRRALVLKDTLKESGVDLSDIMGTQPIDAEVVNEDEPR